MAHANVLRIEGSENTENVNEIVHVAKVSVYGTDLNASPTTYTIRFTENLTSPLNAQQFEAALINAIREQGLAAGFTIAPNGILMPQYRRG